MSDNRQYLCIDLKSFYASVECVERGLDPLTTDLVVADPERTEKTITLAVSPSLKAKGVRNRCRVFEIPKSIDYIMAPPRMQHYIKHSAEIYGIILKYIAKEDIHVYSIDESFMDVTNYLPLYGCTTRELGERIRRDILESTGIPATCGMGPNLFLAKVALDITAKHSPDFFGELDEESFKAMLWDHKPITDFWRIGHGTARRLKELGIETMGQLALYPYPEKLFKQFGIDAEILIDHAWGIEPVTIADIKAYRNQTHSITNAQVLACGYTYSEARMIVKEMTDQVCLEMVAKSQQAASVTVNMRYEKDEDGNIYTSGGTARLPYPSNSREIILPRILDVFDNVTDRSCRIRGLVVNCNNVTDSERGQMSLFANEEQLAEERNRQETILGVKERFGKNALLRGTDLLPKATQRERNRQIGGHKSGE
ncbi:DNA polymerase IV [Slackia heliotrinireducens]|uniref:Nucleotidyltransferase/DNA polymerase involved in DNA repair n=1 Tax=Slackia heliotrinireducens (strain ATCC 29202 / DSM 20476 / NCTC 11029 / RHS 1) TaxID=471855 RepID=C7N1K6_SLAHD|nr:DNA repair protein [Slackia heliotrinireducens]ACV21298.1 nucleotidyltransferase/DNA polymerase involved in DNA repair [Slackia heliotrinireducens DSM 20476]VEG98733.1 DNA polymerase IV [Slackia heliotrinireducens]